VQWSQGPTETTDDYIKRIISKKDELIDIFKKQAITIDALRESLKSIDSNVQIIEPHKLIKPWAGPEEYQAHQISNESNADFTVRTDAYDRK